MAAFFYKPSPLRSVPDTEAEEAVGLVDEEENTKMADAEGDTITGEVAYATAQEIAGGGGCARQWEDRWTSLVQPSGACASITRERS